MSYLFGPSLLKISYSLLLPGDILDLSPFLDSYSSFITPSNSLFQISSPPISLQPFTITISGPSDLQFFKGGKRVCWGVKSISSGERGVIFTVTSSSSTLNDLLIWNNVGWKGAGWGEVCIEDWGELIGELGEEIRQEFSFEVEGTSILFGSVTNARHSFSVFFGNSSSSTPSSSRCLPSLWDLTPDNIYGIQTYPSGNQILPPSLRSSPFTITTKALSPCLSIGMSKDILIPFTFDWSFLEPIPRPLLDVNLNDWSIGADLVIPSSILEDREAFPMDQPVGIQVIFFLPFSVFFSAIPSYK